jgi:pyrophosphatase PpaX
MPARRAPALLFDLDGTLIDSIDLLLASLRHAFAGRPGLAPTDEQWIEGVGTPLVTQLRPWAADDNELQSLIGAYRDYQRAHHDRLTRTFHGTVEVIDALHARGHPMALVTSKASDLARRSLRFVGLERYMDSIVGFDDTTRHKPDAEPVRSALSMLGVAADRAVFVGDSPHDMRAGRAAGTLTAAALWGPFSREALAPTCPDYFLDQIADLPGLVDRLSGLALE